MFIAGVVDTGDKQKGFVDTGDKLFSGVNDTGEKLILVRYFQ